MSDAPTPLWRWLVLGCLCTGGALYVLFAGELPIDKARTSQRNGRNGTNVANAKSVPTPKLAMPIVTDK